MLDLEDRTSIILDAYLAVEGKEVSRQDSPCQRVVDAGPSPLECFHFKSPRRYEGGIPYSRRLSAAKPMIEEGASVLSGNDKPQLRFGSIEEAEASLSRLSQRLPGSEQVWIIAEDVSRVGDMGGTLTIDTWATLEDLSVLAAA